MVLRDEDAWMERRWRESGRVWYRNMGREGERCMESVVQRAMDTKDWLLITLKSTGERWRALLRELWTQKRGCE